MFIPFAVEMTFPSLDVARETLKRHTVSCGESYKKCKQTATCYLVECRSKKDCPYHVRFTLKKTDWVIAIYTEHACSPETHSK